MFTVKEISTLVLLSLGYYQKPDYLLRGRASDGWSYRLIEQGYIKSANGLYGIDGCYTLTPKGEEIVKRFTAKQVYCAKDRLHRIGYVLPDDPIEPF